MIGRDGMVNYNSSFVLNGQQQSEAPPLAIMKITRAYPPSSLLTLYKTYLSCLRGRGDCICVPFKIVALRPNCLRAVLHCHEDCIKPRRLLRHRFKSVPHLARAKPLDTQIPSANVAMKPTPGFYIYRRMARRRLPRNTGLHYWQLVCISNCEPRELV